MTVNEHLEHLELRITEAKGATLATYHVHGSLAASTLLLRGDDPLAEAELINMFVGSLRSVGAAYRLPPDAFSPMTTLTERPLHVVVPWMPEGIDEQDLELVQEVSTHVAGAVLTTPDSSG
jgi:hypothetical protein